MADDDLVWCAYHSDWSSFVLFPDELSALRYAVDHNMQARKIKYGEEINGE